jgi:alkylation response protein AidB-like acyl-CoA dehydrogenase
MKILDQFGGDTHQTGGTAMDFTLSDELTMLRDMVRDFAKEKIAPFADKWDEEHYFPYEEAAFLKNTAETAWAGLRP